MKKGLWITVVKNIMWGSLGLNLKQLWYLTLKNSVMGTHFIKISRALTGEIVLSTNVHTELYMLIWSSIGLNFELCAT